MPKGPALLSSSVVLFDHHPQQLRDAVDRHVDVLTGLGAEAIVPALGRQVIAIVYEFTEPIVHEAGVRPLVPVPRSTRKATALAISGESPPTAIGEMKLSNTVEVRFWN